MDEEEDECDQIPQTFELHHESKNMGKNTVLRDMRMKEK